MLYEIHWREYIWGWPFYCCCLPYGCKKVVFWSVLSRPSSQLSWARPRRDGRARHQNQFPVTETFLPSVKTTIVVNYPSLATLVTLAISSATLTLAATATLASYFFPSMKINITTSYSTLGSRTTLGTFSSYSTIAILAPQATYCSQSTLTLATLL